MRSKDILRKTIVIAMAAALITGVFTGCADTTAAPIEEHTGTPVTTAPTAESTSDKEDAAPDIADTSDKEDTAPDNADTADTADAGSQEVFTESAAVPNAAGIEAEDETPTALSSTAATQPQPDAALSEPQDDNSTPEQEGKKTADGKYNIAPTDLQNADGTFTQDFSRPEGGTVPQQVTDNFDAWSAESAAERGCISNPSKIPYSEITLENAAEAFPYLGFIGYDPDYIEVLPTDSEDEIAKKIWNNIVGNTPYTYFHEGSGIYGMPSHFFASEDEYNAYLAEQQAQKEAADAAYAEGDKEKESGNYSAGVSDEDARKILEDSLRKDGLL